MQRAADTVVCVVFGWRAPVCSLYTSVSRKLYRTGLTADVEESPGEQGGLTALFACFTLRHSKQQKFWTAAAIRRGHNGHAGRAF